VTPFSVEIAKIDRLTSIVVKTKKSFDRPNFASKSKADDFGGLVVGILTLGENSCACNLMHYDRSKPSSGSNGIVPNPQSSLAVD
jgi:hypothetical protein